MQAQAVQAVADHVLAYTRPDPERMRLQICFKYGSNELATSSSGVVGATR